ncbi:MAG: UDP-N-acetylglucosamine 2-epimerase (non-hydrolyzing) [Thaumarchaeota archaeon]|nr:UDP-N-acetylglucosamine 2-epimerase (non-hydrolyzing) [Nitrososphaerota archaeon]
MARLALLVGTRPQIIKSVPVIEEARRRNLDLEIVHTGQHYDDLMSGVFFRSFKLPPAASNLGVGSGTQGHQIGEIIRRLDRLWERDRPDAVLVPGDTNSALASGLLTAKLRIRLGHIEAGARSYDMSMQEEMNRRVIDHLSSVLFAVSPRCRDNLTREDVQGRVVLSGDTMFEVFELSRAEVRKSRVIDELNLTPGEYFVLTLHREENTTDRKVLLKLLREMASFGETVVFPIHPRTRALLESQGKALGKNVQLVEPLDYYAMMRLVRDSLLVATDSGGLQKEVFWSGVPCITLRDKTEWTETVASHGNFLAPLVRGVATTVSRIMKHRSDIVRSIAHSPNPFWPGREKPSRMILDGILRS